MRILITVILFMSVSVLFASSDSKLNAKIKGTWYSTDGNLLYKFIFYKKGHYKVEVGKKLVKGRWLAENNVLTVKINKQVTKYKYAFKDNYLILAQSKTQYMILGKQKKFFIDLLNKMKKQNSNVSNNTKTGVLSDKQFLYLLQNYARMNPNTVYNYLTRFSKNQQYWISIYEAWYNMMVFRACQGNAAYNTARDKQMCAYAKKSYMDTLNLMRNLPSNMRDPWSNAKSQNTKLEISYKCKLGLLDNYTCKNYIGVQKNINRMSNETTKTIIKGFEPLPCTEHYEQGTNVYLGCY